MTDTAPKPARERLASRLGFILLSAGCAIGLGNVWRFPYIVGQNGGGWFVLLYLVFLVLVGLPVLIMEFAAGRASRRSVVRLHAALTPEKRFWSVHGALGFAGCAILMMFYTTVTGWMLLYFLKCASGAFAGQTPRQVGALFEGMLAAPMPQIAAMLFVTASCAGICAAGLQRGLERVTKWMMLFLLLLIVALAVKSVSLPGADAGLGFYLIPDFARMKAVGLGKVTVEAMNHAFFTLSIGIGSMAIFGSYIDRRHTLAQEAAHVAAIDTAVALVSGLIVIPACFAFRLEPGQGPGLVFVTLPNVFNQMAGGRFWGSVFFLFLSCAALTTVLAVFECLIACLRDCTRLSRRRASLAVGLAMPLLSLPCILGFNRLSAFHPFGPGSNILDLEDFIVSNLLLPVGGLGFVAYCCHGIGWGWKPFLAEANAGEGLRIGGRLLRFYCRYLLPLLIVTILLLGL